MHVSIKKELLVQTLAHANRIIEKRQASPVLGCVLLEANRDYIKVTATNMDMTIIDTINFSPVNCIIDEPGVYCLPVGLLYDITKKFSNNSNVILQNNVEKDVIQIKNNKAIFDIHYINSEHFPPLELVNNTDDYVEFSMRVEDLKCSLDTVRVAMSQDIIRTQLNGVYIHYSEKDGTLRFVATDLFRISCVSIKSPENACNIKPIIISKKTVVELLHMLSDIDKDDRVNIKINEKQIIVEANINEGITSIYTSRLVNGSFPEYTTALEIRNDKVLIIGVKELVAAIDRVDTIVSDISNSIQLSISNDKLIISGISKELGSAVEELDCVYNNMTYHNDINSNADENNIIINEYNHNDSDTEVLQICFNSKYFLELIKQINTKDVYIYFNTNVSPTIIKPDPNKISNNLSLVSVIMPVEIIKS